MGSDDDPAEISELSERSEDEVDREEVTVSDTIDREVIWFGTEFAILPLQLAKATYNLDESYQKWDARTRLDAQKEIILWHLTSMNQMTS